MRAGPSRQNRGHDCQEREISLLSKKIHDGKMEGPERIAGPRGQVLVKEITKEFDATFLHEGHCRQWFMRKLYPADVPCPSCGRTLTKKQLDVFLLGKRVTCKQCGRWFNERSGSVLSGTRMTYGQAILLLLLLGLKQSARLIADTLGCDEDTVRSWRHKFEKGN